MEVFKINEMVRGWFVGDFSPTCYKTGACEVARQQYNAGDTESKHYHKIATEITLISKGKCTLNGELFEEGDVVVISPNEAVRFEAIEDTETIVVKVPGALNDKYLVD